MWAERESEQLAGDVSVDAGRAATGSKAAMVAALGLLSLTVLLVTRVAASPLNNGDTWFHLRLGQEFLGDWSLWHPGQLTRFATSNWLPTQWSTEILTAQFENWFGLPGVAWLYGSFYVAFVVAVYGACRRLGAPLPSAVATILVLLSAHTTLSARPQVVSLLFLAISLSAWLETSRDGRPRWWLVPLTWVWATAHGLWNLGIAVGFVFALGLMIEERLSGPRQRYVILAVPLLSLLAALLTPLGPRLLRSQVAVGSRSGLIGEWGPTSFQSLAGVMGATLLGVVVLVWLRRGGVGWTAVLVVGLGAVMLLSVSRLIPFGAVLFAPFFAQALGGRITGTRRAWTLAERWTSAIVSATCLAGLALAVPSTSTRPAGVPSGFEDDLATLPGGATVLVEDSTGSWLTWRFPQLNPVIDGMLDAYPVRHIESFNRFRSVAAGWDKFVEETRGKAAVTLQGSSLSAALTDRLGWREVDRDLEWVFLIAPEETS